MKKASEIKKIRKSLYANDFALSPEIENFIDFLFTRIKDLNQNSVNDIEYSISLSPVIRDNVVKNIEGKFFRLDMPETYLFKFSTEEDFHLISSTKEYKTLDTNLSTFEGGVKTDETISFHDSFFKTNSKYKEIIEDKIVHAFISSEKEASKKQKFQKVVFDNKKKFGIQ